MLTINQAKGSELIGLLSQIFEKENITGFISCENPELNVASNIFIEKGQIVYATSTMYHVKFGDLMIKKGIITPKELNTALKVQKEDPEKPLIGSILVEMGVISERVIPNLLYHQIEVVIYEILAWKKANILFEEHDIEEHPEYKSPVSKNDTKSSYSDLNKLVDSESYIKYLLTNLDEIVQIRQHLSNPDNIPVRANKDYPSQLTFDQRKILRAVEGSNSLNDIIVSSDLDYFRTYQIIYNLAKNGSIEITGVSFTSLPKQDNREEYEISLASENHNLLVEIKTLKDDLKSYEAIIGKNLIEKIEKLTSEKRIDLIKIMKNILDLTH